MKSLFFLFIKKCYSIFGSAIQHNVEAVTSCYYGSTVSGSIAGFLPLTPTKTLCVGDNDACYVNTKFNLFKII